MHLVLNFTIKQFPHNFYIYVLFLLLFQWNFYIISSVYFSIRRPHMFNTVWCHVNILPNWLTVIANPAAEGRSCLGSHWCFPLLKCHGSLWISRSATDCEAAEENEESGKGCQDSRFSGLGPCMDMCVRGHRLQLTEQQFRVPFNGIP